MDKIKVGKIVGTHGLKGEVKIRSNSDFADERFKVGNDLIIKSQNQEIVLKIATVRMHKGNYLVSFENHQNINLIEKYIGSFVYGEKDQSLLDEDEYFYSDLVGMKAVSTEGKEIGIVTSVYDNTAHDILNIDNHGKKLQFLM
ncbi:ribosome maturation factor RimM [Coprobacillaceae bacterium CR2/5/TPMF4]|nr:ribosome maturation factor RimM [Coprobacillaceae bacterium CR2/5/TPMF4]